MPVTIISTHDATETDAIEEMTHEGFEAAAKDYQPGKTEPHSHEYDVCLYIVQGEIGVMDLETGIGQVFGPGDKALVDRGTTHSEEHGVLRMVVGRRHWDIVRAEALRTELSLGSKGIHRVAISTGSGVLHLGRELSTWQQGQFVKPPAKRRG